MRWLLPLIAVSFLAVACTEEAPTDFSADTRTGFMTACTEALEDEPLVADLCECAFDRTQEDFPFDEFRSTDEMLELDPEAELPPEITAIVAECFIQVAEL